MKVSVQKIISNFYERWKNNVLLSLCIILVLHYQVLSGQQTEVDSLKSLLVNAKNDNHKLDILNQLIELIEEDSIWLPYNLEMGQLSSSLLKKTNNAAEKKELQKYFATHLYFNGIYYYDQAQLPKALNFHLQSLSYFEKLNLINKIAEAQNEIGTVYNQLGDYNNALKYLQLSYNSQLKNNDSTAIAQVLNNLGAVYNMLNKKDEALFNFIQSEKLFRAIGDSRQQAVLLSNIGGTYEKMHEIANALEYYKSSYAIFSQLNDAEGLYTVNIEFGNLAMEDKKYADAEMYFTQAQKNADFLGTLTARLGVAKYLHQLYSLQGRYKEAYEMQSLYRVLTDSLRNDENRLSIMRLQAGYEFDKKEEQLKLEQVKKEAQAQAEIQRQKVIRNSILGGASLLTISAIISFLFYKRRREAETQSKIMHLRMQAINAQMNPHFIFNCIHSIQNFISTADMQKADDYLLVFAKLIRKVLDNSTQETVTLEDDLEVLKDYVALEKLRLNFPLEFKINVDENIAVDQIYIPPLLIQPIVENAIIHGIKPLHKNGSIFINIAKGDKEIKIQVQDNGIGRPKEKTATTNRKSYGIPLTKERLQHLSKAARQKSDYTTEDVYNNANESEGTRVTITIPFVGED